MKYILYLSCFLLIASCSTPAPTNFDFDRTNLQDSPNIGINVPQRFNSTLPSSTKMIFYFPGNEVRYDIFNNWAQTPQELLARYFMLYFNNPSKPLQKTAVQGCTINGTIYDFECYSTTNEAIFTINVVITDSNDNIIMTKLYSSREKFEKLSASDFAQAMTKAVNNVVIEIYKDILNLKNSKT